MERTDNRHSSMPPRIGPYRIEGTIGRGGMGAIYKAYDERLTRYVALKRMRAKETRNRDQLRREARAIAQLSHPNIVQIYELLEHDDRDWIVMELVEGVTLRRLIQEEDLGFKEILGLGLDVVEGLAAAHARGIVHRDLKTENVMVTPDGRAKILDFGLARRPSREDPIASGVIRGTPRSMSPEQAMGEDTDHRSDLFSLGVLFYECITGRSPFEGQGKSVFQVLSSVCTYAPPSLCEISPDVPEEFSQLVDRLLEKEPLHRSGSAEEVLLALKRMGDRPPKTAKVLFVDDEPDFEPMIRQWMRPQARRDKWEPVFAGNGREALEVLREDPSIQLVVTDLNMPHLDGFSLLEELEHLGRPTVAVILSAYGDMANIRSAMNLGSFDFLNKPLEFDDLEKTLEKASRQLFKVRENLILRSENQLLEQRHRFIRDALSRYLLGDPTARSAVEPLLEKSFSLIHRNSILVDVQIEHFSDLPDKLDASDLFRLTGKLLADVVATTRCRRGTLLSFDSGRFRIGFGLAKPQEADGRRAVESAFELRRLVGELSTESRRLGGPELLPKIVIDRKNFDSAASDPTLSAPDRAGRLMRNCREDRILITRQTLDPFRPLEQSTQYSAGETEPSAADSDGEVETHEVDTSTTGDHAWSQLLAKHRGNESSCGPVSKRSAC